MSKMNIDTLAAQALEQAKKITGTNGADAHTQEVAFMLACAVAAEIKAGKAAK